MAIVITGNPSDITTPLTSAVASLSSGVGGVVRVATVGPHLSATGDVVQIATPVISGTFSITVIDGTHYDLTGTTFTSTSTGNVSNCSLTPQIQFPTDGDTQSMQLSGLLSGLRALASRTQYLATRPVAIEKTAIFTSSGTWVAPTNLVVQNGAAVVHMFAVGGGGCGGGGPGGGTAAGWSSPGGGGGAGAQPVVEFLSGISPGASYTVTIGGKRLGGGAGGTGFQAAGPTQATPGGQGANGADTTLFLGGLQLARAPGGQGGSGGSVLRTGPVSTGAIMATYGGSGPSRPDFNLYPYRYDGTGVSPIPPMPPWAFGPGNGGPGFTSIAAELLVLGGVTSSNGQSGGGPGSLGAVSGTTLGGGYGGGGGGGGGGVGGNGGSGGAGNNAGNGGTGAAAIGGTLGGGGGGGGAGGEGSSGNNGGNGGAGAVGGSGFMLITWYEYDVVPGV